MKSINEKCPCGSGLKYKKCCKTFHDGKIANNALELMKSRYSAYATLHVNYIINTTYEIKEDLEKFKEEVTFFAKTTHFEKLDILDFSEEDTTSYVSFKATLSTGTKDCSFSEKSKFIKKDKRWYYVDGEIF